MRLACLTRTKVISQGTPLTLWSALGTEDLS